MLSGNLGRVGQSKRLPEHFTNHRPPTAPSASACQRSPPPDTRPLLADLRAQHQPSPKDRRPRKRLKHENKEKCKVSHRLQLWEPKKGTQLFPIGNRKGTGKGDATLFYREAAQINEQLLWVWPPTGVISGRAQLVKGGLAADTVTPVDLDHCVG
jgi:hypothetical protein